MNQNQQIFLDDESRRLQELDAYHILDTPTEAAFDDLVWLAARMFDAPFAAITFIDEKRQWYKSKLGLTLQESPRELAFCNEVIGRKRTMLICDAQQDLQYKSHPMVQGGPGIRFYLGVPLISKSGLAVGTLCILNTKTQIVTGPQIRSLEILAAQVVQRLELRKARKELVKYQSREVETLRLRALGRLTSEIVHEMNNPLGIIMGHTEMMRRSLLSKCPNIERVQKDLATIESTCDRMARIVKGFLRMSRDGQRDAYEKVSVQTLADEVRDLLGPKLKKQNILFQTSGPIEAWFECRPVEVSQVLMNLISNSMDALENSLERKILMAWYYLGDQLVISVSDTGPGIPEGIRGKVMDPFFTTKDADHGTGLGLSISKDICEKHGGSLILQPHTSHTEFILTLPLQQTSGGFSERPLQEVS